MAEHSACGRRINYPANLKPGMYSAVTSTILATLAPAVMGMPALQSADTVHVAFYGEAH